MHDQQTMQLLLSALLLIAGYLTLLRALNARVASRDALPTAAAVLLMLYGAFCAAYCLIVRSFVGEGMVLPAVMALMCCVIPLAGVRFLGWTPRRLRPLPAALLVLWLIAAIYLTLITREGGSRTQILLRFDAIAEALRQRSLLPLCHFALNIALFIPLGLLLPLCVHGVRWMDTAVTALLLTTAIESIQLLGQLGLCDVEDLTANLLGALLGHCLCRVFFPPRSEGG